MFLVVVVGVSIWIHPSSFHFCIFISFLIFILLLFFICRCSSFCCCFSFIFSFRCHASLPWTIAGFLHPFYTFSQVHRRVICKFFIFNHSINLLAASVMAFGGHFLPTGVFYLVLHHLHFNLRLSRLPWGPVVLPWGLHGFILILETQARSICLFALQ